MDCTQKTQRSLKVAIQSDANVLILGPTGTGKTRLARRIHDESSRRRGPFVSVNLAALHEGTIESELFGHERGAFTGADRKRKGLLEAAEGGTVLLDEVGELPPRLQARLLEFLQSRTITPVGGSAAMRLNVRVIAATHRNLPSAVSRGDFREDLFHRLRVICIDLKPIALRWGELDEIVHSCLAEVCSAAGRTVLRISEEVASQLEKHDWPGNFRELRNVLEYAVHAGTGPEILASDLPEWFAPANGNQAKTACFSESPAQIPNHRRREVSIQPLNFKSSMDNFEKSFLSQGLRSNSGNISETARQIGMNKATLIRRIRYHSLQTILSRSVRPGSSDVVVPGEKKPESTMTCMDLSAGGMV